jgi:hypothetical protein
LSFTALTNLMWLALVAVAKTGDGEDSCLILIHMT